MGRKRTHAPLDVHMNRRKAGQFFREPDGALAFTYAADGLDAYSLLARIGRDCVGALQFLPEGEVPEAGDVLTGNPLDDHQVAPMLNDLRRTRLGIRRERDFRFPVAGAQE